MSENFFKDDEFMAFFNQEHAKLSAEALSTNTDFETLIKNKSESTLKNIENWVNDGVELFIQNEWAKTLPNWSDSKRVNAHNRACAFSDERKSFGISA